MTLTIELSPEMERRLTEEAARRGQPAGEFARAVLEERLLPGRGAGRRSERTPEQILSDFFARSPRGSREELTELALQQGVQPVTRFEELLGPEPESEEEFDPDAFLAARRQWQWEGRPLGAGLIEPDNAGQ